MKKEELLKKLEELKKEGKEPHGYLRELLLDFELDKKIKKLKKRVDNLNPL